MFPRRRKATDTDINIKSFIDFVFLETTYNYQRPQSIIPTFFSIFQMSTNIKCSDGKNFIRNFKHLQYLKVTNF